MFGSEHKKLQHGEVRERVLDKFLLLMHLKKQRNGCSFEMESFILLVLQTNIPSYCGLEDT